MSGNISFHDRKHLLYEALVAHYDAKRADALATLQVYFDNAAGIGEHPQIVEEMAKQLEKLANAEDCLEALQRNFTHQQ
tara:strand:+ start:236 stop:472 length:237 start_codon:yes stop_codon:yes gene_type:complete